MPKHPEGYKLHRQVRSTSRSGVLFSMRLTFQNDPVLYESSVFMDTEGQPLYLQQRSVIGNIGELEILLLVPSMLLFAERINRQNPSPPWSGRTRTGIHHKRSSERDLPHWQLTAPTHVTAVCHNHFNQKLKSITYFLYISVLPENFPESIIWKLSKHKAVFLCYTRL